MGGFPYTKRERADRCARESIHHNEDPPVVSLWCLDDGIESLRGFFDSYNVMDYLFVDIMDVV
jgi:hypothetical protein